MHLSTRLSLLLLALLLPTASPLATPPISNSKIVAGYLLLDPTTGPTKLKSLAANAATLPLNRVILSFVSPTMTYVPGSKTLVDADIGYSRTGDFGFKKVKKYVAQLQAGGVEVFLAMGGWNFNCFPYFYMKNSISYFHTGPNYWKIQQFGAGNPSNCNASNMWCYVCEPQSSNTTLNDFSIFPEPAALATWKAAQAQVVAGAKGAPVVWNPQFVGGKVVKDAAGVKLKVPGSGAWKGKKRDPYTDFVYLAKDLGVDGVDLDYEEIWHADTFRSGSGLGPFKLDQTVYKYAAISFDIANAIKAFYPACKFSTAAGAAGAWQGNWWGGNLKGLWYYTNLWYPSLIEFMSKGKNAGGINVMTYDLSSNNGFFECPDTTSDCDLAGQVKYYMATYATAGIPARVGYEVGQPAYPDATHDPSHQLPLTQAALTGVLAGVPSAGTNGGFFWELFKSKNSAPTGVAGQPDNLDATAVAQQVCKKVLTGSAGKRCSGVIPQVGAASSVDGAGFLHGFAGNGNGNGGH
ncbi:hypothetical protein HDU98_000109 [Podochytrium sp. JEL0797]|nr:hypothetical protein HDU98_000109 [Podochytrium sp. JEL0797]